MRISFRLMKNYSLCFYIVLVMFLCIDGHELQILFKVGDIWGKEIRLGDGTKTFLMDGYCKLGSSEDKLYIRLRQLGAVEIPIKLSETNIELIGENYRLERISEPNGSYDFHTLVITFAHKDFSNFNSETIAENIKSRDLKIRIVDVLNYDILVETRIKPK